MSMNKFDFESRVFIALSAVKTDKSELSITLSYYVDQERQAAKVVTLRSKAMEQHPACKVGMDILMGRVERGVEVEVSGVLVNTFYWIKKEGSDARGISTRIYVKTLKVVEQDAPNSEIDEAPVTFFGGGKADQSAVRRITQRAVVRR